MTWYPGCCALDHVPDDWFSVRHTHNLITSIIIRISEVRSEIQDHHNEHKDLWLDQSLRLLFISKSNPIIMNDIDWFCEIFIFLLKWVSCDYLNGQLSKANSSDCYKTGYNGAWLIMSISLVAPSTWNFIKGVQLISWAFVRSTIWNLTMSCKLMPNGLFVRHNIVKGLLGGKCERNWHFL